MQLFDQSVVMFDEDPFVDSSDSRIRIFDIFLLFGVAFMRQLPLHRPWCSIVEAQCVAAVKRRWRNGDAPQDIHACRCTHSILHVR